MKKYLRYLPVLAVAMIVGSVLHFTSPGSNLPQFMRVGMGTKFAYANVSDASGPSYYGNGVSNGCAGVFPQPSAGVGATQAACLAGYNNVACAEVGLSTPGAAEALKCGKTAVGTVTQIGTAATATFTAGGVQVLFGTANANATVVWWGVN